MIAEDYYAILPEVRPPPNCGAHLRYVIDPLMVRFNKQIAERREPLKALLKQREKAGESVTPDVFIAVARSLVSAADARFDEAVRLRAIGNDLRSKMATAKTEAERAPIVAAAQRSIKALQDETIARLADEYEQGAVLSFFFADQLKDIETSGFDITNFPGHSWLSRSWHEQPPVNAGRVRGCRTNWVTTGNRNRRSTAPRKPRMAHSWKLGDIEQTLRQKDYNRSRFARADPEYGENPDLALAQTSMAAAVPLTDRFRLND